MPASVSNLELFRTWRQQEDLGVEWLLDRIAGRVPQTPAMAAGEAFHKALESAGEGEVEELVHGGYRFYFSADCEIHLAAIRELPVTQVYAGLLVRGRVDAVIGNMIVDHKTTQRFDADRLIEGYQWRFYLDMMRAKTFRWNVFVFTEGDDPMTYAVTDSHVLEQATYPGIHEDCEKLARDYALFMAGPVVPKRDIEADLLIGDDDLKFAQANLVKAQQGIRKQPEMAHAGTVACGVMPK